MSCVYRNSYLESDEFYQICLHLLSCIQVPLHILGTFIILKKTPKTMGRVKGSMLTLHLVTAWVDVYFSILMTPVIIFPLTSAYSLGVLSYLGVSMEVMIHVGYISWLCLFASIMQFFENRYNYLVRHDSEFPSRTKKRAIACFLNYFLAILCVIIMLHGTENPSGYREIALQKLPCLPSRILENPNFYMIDVNIVVFLLSLRLYVLLIVSQTLFYFFATSYYLFSTKAQSTRTSQLQKQFFKNLCVQISVPAILFLIPGAYFLYAILAKSFDMIPSNFGMMGICTHGSVSTTIMLLAHKPYRKATMGIFGFKGRNSVNSVVLNVPKPSISIIK